MDIKIHIDAAIHIHSDLDLQTAIDKLKKLMKNENAKADQLNTAVEAAKGQTT